MSPRPPRWSCLTVLGTGQRPPSPVADDEATLSLEQLKALLAELRDPRRAPGVLGQALAARYVVADLDAVPLPLKVPAALRPLALGPVWIEDRRGRRRDVTASYLAQRALRYVGQAAAARTLLDRHRAAVEAVAAADRIPLVAPDRRHTPYVLRTDLVAGPVAGGSVAHLQGVLSGLASQWPRRPRLLTSSLLPGVTEHAAVDVVPVPSGFRDFAVLPALATDAAVLRHAHRRRRHDQIAFAYHRHSAYAVAGAVLARQTGVPLVVEYNGSEVWIARHWGDPLGREELAVAAEQATLAAASLVVVVSDPLAVEVTAAGVPDSRVVVVPNGVDVDSYRPDLDGGDVRRRLSWADDDVVIGFVGTFGRWHGAEVLAEAFGQVVRRHGIRAKLLMVGDGLQHAEARDRLVRAGVIGDAAMVGLVPQADTPVHLAACDILVSPHVPTPDGSAFFGSPTKLFEYMAMGRPIVASALGQIEEVITDGRNGVLVPPGDVDALARALVELAGDRPRRGALGGAARRAAVGRHTWDAHVEAIISRLDQRTAAPDVLCMPN